MPVNVVKNERDEAKWEAAKTLARRSYPGKTGSDFYAVVMHIYQNQKKAGKLAHTNKGGLWLETFSKGNAGRDSMIRKVAATHKVATHHGYKETGNAEKPYIHTSDVPRNTKVGSHARYYEHPETKHSLYIDHHTAKNAHNAKAPSVEWEHRNQTTGTRTRSYEYDEDATHTTPESKKQPIHRLDAHLSKLHGTEPASRRLRRGEVYLKTFSKSLSDCSLCGGTGILRIAFKSLDNEEKSLRLCPLCKPGMD
jgi:hypothetical protein